MMYKISIIIPVYNASDFLRNAMQSLLSQSIGFENLQVIAVDDCSTDESYMILSEYADAYSNVEVYRTKMNSGAAGIPRNIGLEYAKAPYVMFLDPDDFFLEDACEVLYTKIRETQVEIVGGRFYSVDIHGKNPLPGEHDFPQEETRYELPRDLMKVISWIQPIWQRIFDLSFIREKGILFPTGYGQDTVFLNKCFVNGCVLIQIGNYILNYRMHPQSITHGRNKEFFKGYLACTREFEKLLAQYPEALKIRKHREANWHFNSLVSLPNLEENEIEEIFRECRELFIGYTEGNADYVIVSRMIESGLTRESVEYIMKCRTCIRIENEIEREKAEISQYQAMIEQIQKEYRLIIEAYESRLSLQLVRALKEKRFLDMVKIIGRRILKK